MANGIFKKMHAIQAAIPRLAKDGEFDGGAFSYKFLAVDDVIKAVRPLLNEKGVVLYPVVTDIRTDYFSGEASGARPPKSRTHIIVTVDYHFVDSADGSEIVVTVAGEAEDTSDKSVRKSMTSAQKIALIQAFSIETGEPDEHELGAAQAETEEKPDPKAEATQRRIDRAKADHPAAPPKSESKAAAATGANAIKAQIKEQFIDAGKITGPEVNEIAKKKKAELGEKTLNEKVFQAVLAELEEQN